MLERLAKKNGEKVRVVKVDANEHRDWAMKEGIRGVPTVQFYRGGMKLHEFAGAYPEKVIQQKIDQYAVAATPSSGGDGSKPAEPVIKPMPKDWLPPGVTRQ
ncbi:MAG: thioredoxin family protein [Akkermansiaceae bacterium]|nr:thioredoxin family protein [Akkermansiaceae bacterium]